MRAQGWSELYAWRLDRASSGPLFRQIYMQVRSGVLSGTLAPGTALPSTRSMAKNLAVARASVVAAYQQLLIEGYISGRARSGTFISEDLAGVVRPQRRPTARRAKRRSVTLPAQAFSDFPQSTAQSDERPFNTGRTLADARTVEIWRKLTHQAVRSLDARDLGYTDPSGFIELRRR